MKSIGVRAVLHLESIGNAYGSLSLVVDPSSGLHYLLMGDEEASHALGPLSAAQVDAVKTLAEVPDFSGELHYILGPQA